MCACVCFVRSEASGTVKRVPRSPGVRKVCGGSVCFLDHRKETEAVNQHAA